MTDRELMQQALGYMESVGQMDMHPEEWAIAVSLRERLAQPEPAPGYCPHCKQYTIEEPLRTHWEGCEEVHPECKTRRTTREEKIVRPGVYEVPVEQEPVAWLYRDSWGTMKLSQVMPPPVGAFPVYTTPPRRGVGLTDEECIAAIDEYFNFALDHGNVSDRSVIRYARAIEAKLREKNS